MRRKAQAEFALIIGLVVVAVLVAMYSFSSFSPPSIDQVALTDDQKGIYTFVSDAVEEAGKQTVSRLYSNGGFLNTADSQFGYVNAPGYGDVVYWQACETIDVPDMVVNFREGVGEYLMENLPDTYNIDGKNVVFNKNAMNVEATLYEDRIIISATIPTAVDGVQMPQPYRAEVQTRMMEIFEFARNFARMQSDCRMIENNLLFSLIQSHELSDDWVPFGEGNAVRKYTFTWETLSERIEKYARYSLAQTQIGKDLPLNDDGDVADFTYRGWSGTGIEFFFIPAVIDYTNAGNARACQADTIDASFGSKTYENLNIGLTLGVSEFDRSTLSAPEFLEIKPRTGVFSTYLQGLTVAEYATEYSMKYPVIVSVWDDTSSESFIFALTSYVEKNLIGYGCSPYTTMGESQQSFQSLMFNEICNENANEPANIEVVYDSDGSRVLGAEVLYNNCPLGSTADDGEIHELISPEASAELKVVADDNEYVTCYRYDELADLTVEIPRSELEIFHFYTVDITKSGDTYTASAPSTASYNELIEVDMARVKADGCDPRISEVELNIDEDVNIVSEKRYYKPMPIEEYDVSVIMNIMDFTINENKMTGVVNVPSFTPSGGDIYVYAPNAVGFEFDDEEIIKLLFEHCSIEGISTMQYSGGTCSWTDSE